jgi:GxxExxY protein
LARSAVTFGKADLPGEVESVASRVIGAALEVHTEIGPGLLESVYQRALLHELERNRLKAACEVELVVPYKGIEIGGQRADLIVENKIIVELKVVESLAPIHRAQLLSYLRAARLPLGLLINFNTEHLRHGVKRVINERVIPPSSPSRPSR